MPLDPLQILAGGVIGFASAGTLRFWQYRRDMWIAGVNDFCKAIDEAATLATEYWHKEKLPGPASDKLKCDLFNSVRLSESYLLGLQIKIDQYFSSSSLRLLREDKLRIEEKISLLADALTGGNFGSSLRESDEERSRLAQVYASQIITDIRLSAFRALSIKGASTYYFKAFKDRYNMPIIE
jgi:hypothetical protein